MKDSWLQDKLLRARVSWKRLWRRRREWFVVQLRALPKKLIHNRYVFYPLLVVAGCVLFKKFKPLRYKWIEDTFGFSVTDILTMFLAVLAIHFARRHDRELREMEGALSTYRKGSFPHYLNDIEKLAQSACRLDILLDCLDFGSFFAPEDHERVHKAMCALPKHAQVRILVCGARPEPLTGPSGQKLLQYRRAKRLVNRYRQALAEDVGFKDWIGKIGGPDDEVVKMFNQTWLRRSERERIEGKAEVTLTAALKDQCVSVCSGRRLLSLNEDDALWQVLLQLRQFWFAKDLPRFGVQIHAQEDPEPMFFWIKYKNEDEKDRHVEDDALFTFAVAARGPGTVGYSTHDPELLNTLRAIFEKKWEASSPTDKRSELEWLKFLREHGQLRSPVVKSLSAKGGAI